jgi:hypothetical protein
LVKYIKPENDYSTAIKAMISAIFDIVLEPFFSFLLVTLSKTADRIDPIRLGSRRASRKFITGVIEPVLLFVYKLTISIRGNTITSLLSMEL